MNVFPNTDNHPAEYIYYASPSTQATQMHENVAYGAAEARDNKNHVDKDFLDVVGKVDLMNAFPNTRNNPIKYICTRVTIRRVVCLDFRAKI